MPKCDFNKVASELCWNHATVVNIVPKTQKERMLIFDAVYLPL